VFGLALWFLKAIQLFLQNIIETIYFLVVYKQKLKHLQGFENLAGVAGILVTLSSL